MEGVPTWLDSVVRLGPLPSVVARAATTRDDPLETQLLELTTATEGLHRLILPQRKRMTDDQAKEARSKALEALKELVDDVHDAVPAALDRLTDQSYPPCGCSRGCSCSKPESTPPRSVAASRTTRATSSSWHRHGRGFQPR